MGKIAILVDPEKQTPSLTERVTKLQSLGLKPQVVLLGGSTGALTSEEIFDEAKNLGLPVWLFPGNENQLSSRADRLLLPVVISGRNAEMLIGRHVAAARKIQSLGIPVTPMGYILIDGGIETAVQRQSQTLPIPPNETDKIVSTALAGEQLGQQMIYLEAGSGALRPVPSDVIKAVRKEVKNTLIVGGGLRTKDSIQAAFNAGADMVVIGTFLETSNR